MGLFPLACIHVGSNVVAYNDMKTLSHPTIRHSQCELLLSPSTKVRCQSCTEHRQSLNILSKRLNSCPHVPISRYDPLSHANYTK